VKSVSIAAPSVSERVRSKNKQCTALKRHLLFLDIETPFFGRLIVSVGGR
jgi:hypothetical protein